MFCTSQEIGWEDRLQNDLYWVKRELSPSQLNFFIFYQNVVSDSIMSTTRSQVPCLWNHQHPVYWSLYWHVMLTSINKPMFIVMVVIVSRFLIMP